MINIPFNKRNSYWRLLWVLNILLTEKLNEVILFFFDSFREEQIVGVKPQEKAYHIWQNQLCSCWPEEPTEVAWVTGNGIWTCFYKHVVFFFFVLDKMVEVLFGMEHRTYSETMTNNYLYYSNGCKDLWNHRSVYRPHNFVT